MRYITLAIILLLTTYTLNAQTVITGTVSDSKGPLPFTNVIIAGTDSGTVANAKGDFSIETSKGNTLIISYVGHEPKHITIDNIEHLNITLEMDSLDEVVLIGYDSRIYHHTICLSSSTKTTSFQPINRATATSNNNMAYPNPTSTGYITLDMQEPYTRLEISVHAITGQRLIHQTYNQPKERLSLDISKFSTGIYIINMIADGERLPVQKIIRS